MGHNDATISEEIKALIAQEDISVLTAVEEIALILMDANENEEPTNFDINGEFVNLLGDAAPKVQTYDMSGKSEEEIETFIAQNL